MIYNYILSVKWVFDAKKDANKTQEFIVFIVLSAVSYTHLNKEYLPECENVRKIPIQADTLEIWKNKTIEYFNAHKKEALMTKAWLDSCLSSSSRNMTRMMSE